MSLKFQNKTKNINTEGNPAPWKLILTFMIMIFPVQTHQEVFNTTDQGALVSTENKRDISERYQSEYFVVLQIFPHFVDETMEFEQLP